MADAVRQTLEAALAYHRAGRLSEAIALYNQALERDPENADALHLLGVATGQDGDHGGGERLIHQAQYGEIDVSLDTFPDTFGNTALESELAADVTALARWRQAARPRISASSLMDHAGHTPALEQAYRAAWRRWCESPDEESTTASRGGTSG